MTPLPVTVVSGLPGAHRETLLEGLPGRVAVVREPMTLGAAVHEAIDGGAAHLVVAPAPDVPPACAANALYRLSGRASVHTMVTVLDAPTVLRDWTTSTSLRDRGLAAGDDDGRLIAELLVAQLEFADLIVVHDVAEIPLGDRERLLLLLRHMNRRATLVACDTGTFGPAPIGGAPVFDPVATPRGAGWMRAFERTAALHDVHGDVATVVYRARRPMHPERAHALLWQADRRLLRSRGIFWLASRPLYVGSWDQAGPAREVAPGGFWWASVPAEQWPEASDAREHILADWEPRFGDRRQAIALTGIGLDVHCLSAALDACLLTEAELAGGPTAWERFSDPFPQWTPAPDVFPSFARAEPSARPALLH